MSRRHHYRACGRDNVWLANGFIIEEADYGPTVAIVDAFGLHRAIEEALASDHASSELVMTHDRAGWRRAA